MGKRKAGRKPSRVMIDKATTIKRKKPGPPSGRPGDETTPSVTRSLAVFPGRI
jgi:hypothetical protein